MPWWGWLLIGLAIVALPIKLRIWKNMLQKKADKQKMIDEDF